MRPSSRISSITLPFSPFKRGPGGALTIILLHCLFANCPQVRAHGLFATRQILLCVEGCFVGSNVLQRFAADCHCGSYSCEGCTCSSLLLRQLAVALVVRIRLADVDTSAVRIGGRSGTVSTD